MSELTYFPDDKLISFENLLDRWSKVHFDGFPSTIDLIVEAYKYPYFKSWRLDKVDLRRGTTYRGYVKAIPRTPFYDVKNWKNIYFEYEAILRCETDMMGLPEGTKFEHWNPMPNAKYERDIAISERDRLQSELDDTRIERDKYKAKCEELAREVENARKQIVPCKDFRARERNTMSLVIYGLLKEYESRPRAGMDATSAISLALDSLGDGGHRDTDTIRDKLKNATDYASQLGIKKAN